MKKVLFALLACLLLAGCSSSSEAAEAVTLTGTGNGEGGDVVVEVTMEGDKITAVTVTEHSETPGISDAAISGIPTAIVEANSTDVETVTGATVSSNAIIEAVNNAIASK